MTKHLVLLAVFGLVACSTELERAKRDLLALGIEIRDEATLHQHYEDATLTDSYEEFHLNLSQADVSRAASSIRELNPFIDSLLTSQQIAPFEYARHDTVFSVGYRTLTGYALESFRQRPGYKFNYFELYLDTTTSVLQYSVFVN